MRVPPEFHGTHLAPLVPAHERISWYEPTPRTDRMRVRRHTCCCQNVQFELCEAGGLVFIRRLEFSGGNVEVRESDRIVAAQAARLWNLLLHGQAC